MRAEMRLFCMWLELTIVVLSTAGCNRDGGVIGSVRLPNIRGKFVIEDDARTRPLSSVKHSIYYVNDSGRKLIFRGYGGSVPVLSLLSPDVVLVRYCGGVIYETASFLESEASTDEIARALRLQPIISPGLSANGRQICRGPQ